MFDIKKFIKLNRITLLIGILFLLLLLVPITYSRFESKKNTKTGIDTAFYVVDTAIEEKSLQLGSIVPSDEEYIYNFTIANYKGTKRAEVNIEYDLIIKTTTNLPLTYNLYKEGSDESIIKEQKIEQDEYGTYYNIISTNKEELPFNEDKINKYKLVVKFPKIYDSFEYQNIVEGVIIIVDSRQKITE